VQRPKGEPVVASSAGWNAKVSPGVYGVKGFPSQRPLLVLAPMAGYTDYSCRVLAREAGADLAYTELISANAVHYRNERTVRMMDWGDDDHPVAAQIFGAEPEVMAEAAAFVAARGADIVDVNLGCSVPKVLRTGASAALLRDLGRLRELLQAVVAAANVPVTIKTRAGWDASSINACEVAAIAEEVGVCAVAVHGRTACQGFTGQADWGLVAAVKRSVGIPVIGSGDVIAPEDAARRLEETGCDGVMIGRAAIGNPWVFARARAFIEYGELLSEPDEEERLRMLLRHARMAVDRKGEKVAIHQLRGHAAQYIRHMPSASALRSAFMQASTLRDVEQLVLGALRGRAVGAAA